MDIEQWFVPMLRSAAQAWGEAAGPLVGLVVFTFIGLSGGWLWWFAGPMIVLLCWVLAVQLTRQIRVDVAAGTISRRTMLLRRVTQPLSGLTEVAVVARGAQGASLRLVGPGGTVTIPVLVQTMFGGSSQSAETLDRLVEMLSEAPGSGLAVTRLRAQARHVERGGAVHTSPLLGKV